MTIVPAFLLALALAPSGAAAQERPSDPSAASAAAPKIERLAEWPPIAPEDEARAKLAIERLVAANTPAMEEGGRADVLALGAPLLPKLIDALGRARNEAAVARLEGVMDLLVDATHTRLLAEEFDAREPARRRWALSRASRHPDPGIRAAAEGAWKAAVERFERVPKGDKRAEERLAEARAERYAAALAATSSGSLVAIDALLEHAAKDWRQLAPEIRAAAPGARGAEATRLVADRVRTGSGALRLGALRLLALVGEGDAATSVALVMLDDHDMAIRMAAINALRAIVDQAPPMDDLSAFESIEHADAWKRRLQQR